MEEELIVVLNRRDDPTAGLGFSLLDKPGFPPVIYDIEENSPAAESEKVEAGDVILEINDIDVRKCSIKEVLKCLRLAGRTVSLKLKRDQSLKEKILYYLSTSSENAENELHPLEDAPLTNGNEVTCNRPLNSRARRKEFSSPPFCGPLQDITSYRKFDNEPAASTASPICEAYVMTGERVLKLTKNPSLAPKYQKKVDSLKSHQNFRRNACNQNHRYNKSTPSSPVESDYNEVKSSSACTSPVALGAPLQIDATSMQSERNSSFLASVSKSDEQIQYKKSVSVSSISVQVDDEELTSSLNTLLDTKSDNKTEDKRVVWTCNAPKRGAGDSVSTIASSENVSLQSVSPPSPTSVSSSVMSSMSSSTDRKRPQMVNSTSNNNSIDSSQVEALSNISSPDYQEETSDLLNSHDIGMEVTDPSDSDSTLLVSEPKIRRLNKCVGSDNQELNGIPAKYGDDEKSNHRIVIQVKGVEKDNKSFKFCDTTYVIDNNNCNVSKLRRNNNLKEENEESEKNVDPKKVAYETLSECDNELLALTEGAVNLAKSISPPHSVSSEEESGSDVESLHSFHYSPKGVDYPSAHRLAKRLYHLDGFKKSDVSRHLSKDNEFNRAVAEEYLKYFNFENDSLDVALRKFLKQFCLTGETQERERVLGHFSKRYLDCNPGSFNSQDAAHTLTCAIMLLNSDLHGNNIGRRMSCNGFIKNLSGLNDGEDFPRELLETLYHAIKNSPLEWAVDDEIEGNVIVNNLSAHGRAENFEEPSNYLTNSENCIIKNNELNVNGEASVIDCKKGYVVRKCCYEPNGKKTPFGKRGWKMLYCTLRDLCLYLYKDEQELNKNPNPDNAQNVIRLHHALATKATDYKKKECVFRLQTADRAEYLFRTSGEMELQSWVESINFVCASLSAPALPEPVGSLKKFQKPLLPSAKTRLKLPEQLRQHEQTVERLEKELENHRKYPPEKSSKNLVIQNYNEKESFLCYEIKRYKAYVHLLQSKLSQLVNTMSSVPLADIESDDENLMSNATSEESEETNSPVSVNRKRSKKKS